MENYQRMIQLYHDIRAFYMRLCVYIYTYVCGYIYAYDIDDVASNMLLTLKSIYCFYRSDYSAS